MMRSRFWFPPLVRLREKHIPGHYLGNDRCLTIAPRRLCSSFFAGLERNNNGRPFGASYRFMEAQRRAQSTWSTSDTKNGSIEELNIVAWVNDKCAVIKIIDSETVDALREQVKKKFAPNLDAYAASDLGVKLSPKVDESLEPKATLRDVLSHARGESCEVFIELPLSEMEKLERALIKANEQKARCEQYLREKQHAVSKLQQELVSTKKQRGGVQAEFDKVKYDYDQAVERLEKFNSEQQAADPKASEADLKKEASDQTKAKAQLEAECEQKLAMFILAKERLDVVDSALHDYHKRLDEAKDSECQAACAVADAKNAAKKTTMKIRRAQIGRTVARITGWQWLAILAVFGGFGWAIQLYSEQQNSPNARAHRAVFRTFDPNFEPFIPGMNIEMPSDFAPGGATSLSTALEKLLKYSGLLVIDGPSGIGKTHLLQSLLKGQEGIVYVQFKETQRDLVKKFSAAFDLIEYDELAIKGALLNFRKQNRRPVVIVLDDAHKLVNEPGIISFCLTQFDAGLVSVVLLGSEDVRASVEKANVTGRSRLDSATTVRLTPIREEVMRSAMLEVCKCSWKQSEHKIEERVDKEERVEDKQIEERVDEILSQIGSRVADWKMIVVQSYDSSLKACADIVDMQIAKVSAAIHISPQLEARHSDKKEAQEIIAKRKALLRALLGSPTGVLEVELNNTDYDLVGPMEENLVRVEFSSNRKYEVSWHHRGVMVAALWLSQQGYLGEVSWHHRGVMVAALWLSQQGYLGNFNPTKQQQLLLQIAQKEKATQP